MPEISKVRISRTDYETLSEHLRRGNGIEYAAYLTAGTFSYESGGRSVIEFLVNEVVGLPPHEYDGHGVGTVSLTGSSIRQMADRAAPSSHYVDDRAILIAHNHPGSTTPRYSKRDDATEPDTFQPLTSDGEGPHGSLLLGEEGITGRVWPADPARIRTDGVEATSPIDEIVIVGETELERIRTTDSQLPSLPDTPSDPMRARQTLAHGAEGNARLRATHVAVVGAGGLGSLIIQTLTRLGVGKMTAIDPDVVETTNLSRIVGAQPEDAGSAELTPTGSETTPAAWSEASPQAGLPKIEAMERLVANADPSIGFRGVCAGIETERGLNAALEADILVTATDNETSRDIISEAGQRYLRPVFDAGTSITAQENSLHGIESTFVMHGAPRPCRNCLGLANRERIRVEDADEEDLVYGLNMLEGEQPAVITINNYPASQLGFALHAYVTGLLAQRYEPQFDTGSTQLLAAERRGVPYGGERCTICEEDSGIKASGDRAPLPGISSHRETAPENIKTGLVAELGLEATPEAVSSKMGDDAGLLRRGKAILSNIFE